MSFAAAVVAYKQFHSFYLKCLAFGSLSIRSYAIFSPSLIFHLFFFFFFFIFLLCTVLEKYVKPAEFLYGRVIRVWVLIFPFFAVLHPEDLQTILSSRKHTEKIFFYKLLHNFLGNGLITSSGKIHSKESEYFLFQTRKFLFFVASI